MSTEKHGRRPERPPFWVAFGFIAAFAATILTVVLTGLSVRAPDSDASKAASAATTVGAAARTTTPIEARRAAATPTPESERPERARDVASESGIEAPAEPIGDTPRSRNVDSQ